MAHGVKETGAIPKRRPRDEEQDDDLFGRAEVTRKDIASRILQEKQPGTFPTPDQIDRVLAECPDLVDYQFRKYMQLAEAESEERDARRRQRAKLVERLKQTTQPKGFLSSFFGSTRTEDVNPAQTEDVMTEDMSSDYVDDDRTETATSTDFCMVSANQTPDHSAPETIAQREETRAPAQLQQQVQPKEDYENRDRMIRFMDDVMIKMQRMEEHMRLSADDTQNRITYVCDAAQAAMAEARRVEQDLMTRMDTINRPVTRIETVAPNPETRVKTTQEPDTRRQLMQATASTPQSKPRERSKSSPPSPNCRTTTAAAASALVIEPLRERLNQMKLKEFV